MESGKRLVETAVPWKQISPRDIQCLMNHLFTEANVPPSVVREYMLELNQYLYRHMWEMKWVGFIKV